MNEADTCRTYILPNLKSAGWEDEAITEQMVLTPGRIVPIGGRFDSATQIGMTATPKRDDNVDTYNYFGDPIYTYSLRQGIDDGFLAPYRVYRVIPDVDASGLQIDPGVLDRFGREIPPDLYGTKDFERIVSLLSRTEVVARHLTE
jgi:type I restriction enzyme R subunit